MNRIIFSDVFTGNQSRIVVYCNPGVRHPGPMNGEASLSSMRQVGSFAAGRRNRSNNGYNAEIMTLRSNSFGRRGRFYAWPSRVQTVTKALYDRQ